jgi:hypothetical protein
MRDQSIGTKDQINNVFSNVEMIYKVPLSELPTA